jgi:hypothetical protein
MEVVPFGSATEPRELTLEERRERRALHREKQRENNIFGAAKMHKGQLKIEAQGRRSV